MSAVAMGGTLIVGLVVGGAALSAGSIGLLRPLLVRYAMARPSARGLHTVPTPQGGGIAVLLSCAVSALLGGGLLGLVPADMLRVAAVLALAGGLALVGLVDDIRPLPALPRLLLQLAAMAGGIALLPEGSRVLPILPGWLEAAVLTLAGAWFINLTNFMDGMDWITVADAVPVTATLTALAAFGALPLPAGLIALGLLGGLLGYAPFNRPVARLFLGDVGSLPIGFLLAYGLFALAGQGGAHGLGALGAAVILPLYPIADSGLTLLWRLSRRENVSQPHRSHFYQVAVARGLTVWGVLGRVLAANLALAVLALLCFADDGVLRFAYGGAAVLVVGLTLQGLRRDRQTKTAA